MNSGGCIPAAATSARAEPRSSVGSRSSRRGVRMRMSNRGQIVMPKRDRMSLGSQPELPEGVKCGATRAK